MADEEQNAPEDGELTSAPPAEDGGQQPPPEDDGEPPAPPSIEDIAREIGWMPREEFRGDPAQWRPADEFIRQGHQIQRGLSRDLKELRSSVDTITATNSQMMRDALARQKNELLARYEQAVDEGDPAAAFRLSQEITTVDSKLRTPAAPQGPSPDALAFAERHASWFNKDPLATERAVKLCARLEAEGYSEAYQLAAAEKTIKEEFPNLFRQQKAAPGVNQPGRPVARSNGKQGFAQLPPEAQKAATRFAEEHGIPKDVYAANYFANLKEGR